MSEDTQEKLDALVERAKRANLDFKNQLTDDKYKKAWERLRHDYATHSFVNVVADMDRLIPPPRVYDPDTEWVPVSSGQMPKAFDKDFLVQWADKAIGLCSSKYLSDFKTIEAWRCLPAPYVEESK